MFSIPCCVLEDRRCLSSSTLPNQQFMSAKSKTAGVGILFSVHVGVSLQGSLADREEHGLFLTVDCGAKIYSCRGRCPYLRVRDLS